MPIEFLLGALALLIILSAFFSGSETALMTLNRYRLRHLADSGNQSAKLAENLLEKPDRLIGLILLGNNLVNNLAAALVAVLALQLVGPSAVTTGTLILTLVMLIVAEVTPKTLAALQPERLAFPAAWVYTPLNRVAYPLVWLVNRMARLLLAVLRVPMTAGPDNTLSQEELRTVVIEAGAMIPSRHQKMLLNILDLEKATVEDIMVPRQEVDGIDINQPQDEILAFLRTTPYSRVLVYDGTIDNILGVLHSRGLMQAVLEGELDQERLREAIRKPYYIQKGTTLNTQLMNFQRERHHVGLVVDEYGDLLGLVTISDLLEEIVGEFTTDPSDKIADVQPQDDGSYLVDGSAAIRDLVRGMDWDLPRDGPKTLNGLIMEQLESIPEAGISLLIAGYPVEIVQTQGNAVKLARLRPADRRPTTADET